jgi:tetratricopeptide (TPR) repeat protein
MSRRRRRGGHRGQKAGGRAEATDAAADRPMMDEVDEMDDGARTRVNERDEQLDFAAGDSDAKSADEPAEDAVQGGGEDGAAEEIRRGDDDLDEVSSPDRAEIEALYRRARAAAEDGRLVEAEKGYRELLFRDPGHLKARNNLGYVYDALGEPARALEEYQAALAIDPQNVQLLNNVGAVLGTQRRPSGRHRCWLPTIPTCT